MMRPLSPGTATLSMISKQSQHESIQLLSILGPGPKHHSDPSARDQDGIMMRAPLISLEVSSSGWHVEGILLNKSRNLHLTNTYKIYVSVHHS